MEGLLKQEYGMKALARETCRATHGRANGSSQKSDTNLHCEALSEEKTDLTKDIHSTTSQQLMATLFGISGAQNSVL